MWPGNHVRSDDEFADQSRHTGSCMRRPADNGATVQVIREGSGGVVTSRIVKPKTALTACRPATSRGVMAPFFGSVPSAPRSVPLQAAKPLGLHWQVRGCETGVVGGDVSRHCCWSVAVPSFRPG